MIVFIGCLFIISHASAQVNHITSPADAIADWIIVEGEEPEQGGDTHIRVFLNRAVTGDFTLNVAYEQLLEDISEKHVD